VRKGWKGLFSGSKQARVPDLPILQETLKIPWYSALLHQLSSRFVRLSWLAVLMGSILLWIVR